MLALLNYTFAILECNPYIASQVNDPDSQQYFSQSLASNHYKPYNLSTQMGALLKQHDKKLEDHDERIGRLEQKPAKRWDSFVGKVIELVLAFGFGGLLVWLGLKDSI